MDVSGVENKQGYYYLLYLKLLVKEYTAWSFLFWWGEVGVPFIKNSLVKLDKGKVETVVFSKPVSLIAVACQNRQVKS